MLAARDRQVCQEAYSFEVEELRTTAARLLATGLTDQQVAETIGVTAEQVRRWDDHAVTDAERDQLVDGLAAP